MSEDILKKIIDSKIKRLVYWKKALSTEKLHEELYNYEHEMNLKFYNFKKKIQNNLDKNKISIIGEIKCTSPSAGSIIKDSYHPENFAKIYKNKNTTCLSVLCEEEFFLGHMEHIIHCKVEVDLPILCKDFFIDKYQILWARSRGADAILIILAAVTDNLADELYQEALKYNMSIIVEVHTVEEAKRALRFKDALIGINNRNLKTLKTDLNTTFEINDVLINHKGPLVSESGFKNKDDVLKITNQTNIKTFLIGESLLKNMEGNSIFSLI